jgi:mono/diheme cytochrome c family protein
MAMPPFPPDHLSDREIGLIVAYLKHMAGRKQASSLDRRAA